MSKKIRVSEPLYNKIKQTQAKWTPEGEKLYTFTKVLERFVDIMNGEVIDIEEKEKEIAEKLWLLKERERIKEKHRRDSIKRKTIKDIEEKYGLTRKKPAPKPKYDDIWNSIINIQQQQDQQDPPKNDDENVT